MRRSRWPTYQDRSRTSGYLFGNRWGTYDESCDPSPPKRGRRATSCRVRCCSVNTSDIYNCGTDKRSQMDIKIEINKRFGMPVYIPLISLICCFLLASRKDKKMFYLNKYIYFFIGFLILALAEIIVRYSGISWNHTFVYYLIPLGMSPLLYIALIRTFKYENLS